MSFNMSEVYGDITLKQGLTEIDVGIIKAGVGIDIEVGEDTLEFDGKYFDVEDLIGLLPEEDVKECNLECIGRYEDIKITHRNGEFYWYSKEYLCDTDNENLIEELKARGYEVKKNEERYRDNT